MGSVEAARMAAEELRRQGAGQGGKDRDPRSRARQQGRRRLGDRAQMVRRGWRRHGIADLANSLVALAVQHLARERNKITMTFRPRGPEQRLTGKACSPNTIQWVNDAWATGNTTAAAMMARGGKDWYFVTVELRARPGHRGRGHQLHREARRQGAGFEQASARHLGLRLVPAAGAELQGQGDRARQCRRRHHQRGEAGRRVRHPAGRPDAWWRSCCSSTTSTAWD